ncbi:hypothetical protein A3C29_06560 [Candidatus Daviesbacteria bacterium RIFCSPHIGHO2_02_FULL_40_16]|nr:MAG: hypothetical protein A3C29_06560 [Candidatus Daviesbacteria bacterium RIFCSPHIGHO2_02_FULL_40_16]
MAKQQQASEEYRKLRSQCKTLLRQIECSLDQHLKEKENEKPDFALVGDLYFIKDQLTNVSKFIKA